MKTSKEKRQEEGKLINDGKDVNYPTYDHLALEDKEESAYLLFTVRNEQ